MPDVQHTNVNFGLGLMALDTTVRHDVDTSLRSVMSCKNL
ncbi:MAG: hypothetical protein ETSY2_41345 [Candidatus Entotheonella gemina]|uniref:Uncharacterized protein n=1 Tax=Candidatus Entotheonella gemina TaxID=1429439 RepID=W4LMS9_9BACT|nr:MAG: hypothetical protein ETSY2_41345 [Candidatus Entotheonella gemina]